MSGVWKGLLSVQDSGRPQNITHADQGTEASQDQVIHSTGTRALNEDQRKHEKKNPQNNPPQDFDLRT